MKLLESVEVFDVFRGKNVPLGYKSVAYTFIYRHSDRTLTDGEVNMEHEKVITKLKHELGAVVRSK
jgi:phenylalanyl-tRNA synthetase beta chain